MSWLSKRKNNVVHLEGYAISSFPEHYEWVVSVSECLYEASIESSSLVFFSFWRMTRGLELKFVAVLINILDMFHVIV